MLNDNIRKLLDSEVPEDNAVGWELVKATNVSYNDVVEYIEDSKVATNWQYRYVWNGKEFERNSYFDSTGMYGHILTVPNGGGTPIWMGASTTGDVTYNSGETTTSTSY